MNTKQELITLLNSNVREFNQFQKDNPDLKIDLQGADLREVNLDFADWSLSCESLRPITDEKQRTQLMFHTLSLFKHAKELSDEERAIFDFCKDYANKFHREDVERL